MAKPVELLKNILRDYLCSSVNPVLAGYKHYKYQRIGVREVKCLETDQAGEKLLESGLITPSS